MSEALTWPHGLDWERWTGAFLTDMNIAEPLPPPEAEWRRFASDLLELNVIDPTDMPPTDGTWQEWAERLIGNLGG